LVLLDGHWLLNVTLTTVVMVLVAIEVRELTEELVSVVVRLVEPVLRKASNTREIV
jgi:hypothetical protein